MGFMYGESYYLKLEIVSVQKGQSQVHIVGVI